MKLAERRHELLGAQVHDRVERDDAGERSALVQKREHVADAERDVGMRCARLVDHLRREIEPFDVRTAPREVASDVSGSAADVGDPAARTPLDERIEERAVERLTGELVAELLAIRARDGRVTAPQSVRAWIVHAPTVSGGGPAQLRERVCELAIAARAHEARDLVAIIEEDQRGPQLHAEAPAEALAATVLDLEVLQIRARGERTLDQRLRGLTDAAPASAELQHEEAARCVHLLARRFDGEHHIDAAVTHLPAACAWTAFVSSVHSVPI